MNRRLNLMSYRQYKILKPFRKIRGIRRIWPYTARERRLPTKGNEYPDKTFYIIRRNTMMGNEPCGLMADLRFVISHLIYADKNDFTPVVDMQSFINAYLEKNEVGRVNAWEFYFKQPAGFSLEEALKGRNIVASSMFSNEPEDWYSDEVYRIVKKYIVFSENIEKRAEEEMRKMRSYFGDAKDVHITGIKLRGTDYVSKMPKYHAKAPTVRQASEIIDEKLKDWNEEPNIFLASEDSSVIQLMKKIYGEDRIYTMNIQRFHEDETWYRTKKYLSRKRLNGEDYCTEIACLTKCDNFIASGSQGTMAAILINNRQYLNSYKIDLGRY